MLKISCPIFKVSNSWFTRNKKREKTSGAACEDQPKASTGEANNPSLKAAAAATTRLITTLCSLSLATRALP